MIWDDYWAFVFMSSGRINADTTGIMGNEIVSSNRSGNGLLSLKLSENMIKCLYYSFRDECGFGRITRDTFFELSRALSEVSHEHSASHASILSEVFSSLVLLAVG